MFGFIARALTRYPIHVIEQSVSSVPVNPYILSCDHFCAWADFQDRQDRSARREPLIPGLEGPRVGIGEMVLFALREVDGPPDIPDAPGPWIGERVDIGRVLAVFQ